MKAFRWITVDLWLNYEDKLICLIWTALKKFLACYADFYEWYCECFVKIKSAIATKLLSNIERRKPFNSRNWLDFETCRSLFVFCFEMWIMTCHISSIWKSCYGVASFWSFSSRVSEHAVGKLFIPRVACCQLLLSHWRMVCFSVYYCYEIAKFWQEWSGIDRYLYVNLLIVYWFFKNYMVQLVWCYVEAFAL